MPVGPPPSLCMYLSVHFNHRATLELLPVSESGRFDMPRFMPALALFNECFHFSRRHRSQLPIDPSASDLVDSRRRCSIVGAQIFSMYCIRNEKIVAQGLQDPLFPIGPWPKARTTVLIAIALYARYAPRGSFAIHRFEGYGTSRA